MIHIAERCICGASIDIDHEVDSQALELVKDWRKNHKHQDPPRQPGYRMVYGSSEAS